MNIHVRACVQSVHHQHAHMISDSHASIDDVLVKVKNKFPSSVFTGRRITSMSWIFVSYTLCCI